MLSVDETSLITILLIPNMFYQACYYIDYTLYMAKLTSSS